MAFADDSFSGACISCIRNVPDRLLGLKEMCRVVEPGGKVAILELSEPPGGIMAFSQTACPPLCSVAGRTSLWLKRIPLSSGIDCGIPAA